MPTHTGVTRRTGICQRARGQQEGVTKGVSRGKGQEVVTVVVCVGTEGVSTADAGEGAGRDPRPGEPGQSTRGLSYGQQEPEGLRNIPWQPDAGWREWVGR